MKTSMPGKAGSGWQDFQALLDDWGSRADDEPSVALPSDSIVDQASALQGVGMSSVMEIGAILPEVVATYLSTGAPARQLVRLARIARHFGFSSFTREILMAAMAREPNDFDTYREFWLEISMNGASADEAVMRGALCSYVIEEIRVQLTRLGGRYYAISLHESGFGDQMLTASVSAKLAEMFGLHFVGVVDEHLSSPGRIGALFDDDRSWFELIFGTELPLVGKASCQQIGLEQGSLATILTALLRQLETMTTPFATVCLFMGAQTAYFLQTELCDARGSVLRSSLLPLIRQAATSVLFRDLPCQSPGRIRVALHLRIGDVVNIPLILPGQFVIPHAVSGMGIHAELVPEELMPYHSRGDRVPFFLALAKACRDRFGGEIELDIATDGYTRILASLARTEYVDQLVGAAGRSFDVDAVRDYFLDQDEKLRSGMSALGRLHYGEQADAFQSSIRAIRSADIIITTSGQFAPAIANFLGRPGHQQTLFTFHRDARFLLVREGVSVSFLGRNLQLNTEAILEKIAVRVRKVNDEFGVPVEGPSIATYQGGPGYSNDITLVGDPTAVAIASPSRTDALSRLDQVIDVLEDQMRSEGLSAL
jgi:hypothetical protein